MHHTASWDEEGNGPVARPPAAYALITGLLALVGGGLLASGVFLKVLSDNSPITGLAGQAEIDLDVWPWPTLFVVLASLLAALGLLAALTPKHRFGVAMVGATVIPGVAAGGIQGLLILGVLDVVDYDTAPFEIGGWLLSVGSALALIGALVALIGTSVVSRRAGHPMAPALGLLGVAGLMLWALLPLVRTSDGEPAPGGEAVQLSGVPNSALILAIGMIAVLAMAIGTAAGRAGAGAVGLALGGALTVAGWLGGTYVVGTGELKEKLGAELRTVPVILLVVTVVVLLLLALTAGMTREPEVPDEDEDRPLLAPEPDAGAAPWPGGDEVTGQWTSTEPESPWRDQPESEPASWRGSGEDTQQWAEAGTGGGWSRATAREWPAAENSARSWTDSR